MRRMRRKCSAASACDWGTALDVSSTSDAALLDEIAAERERIVPKSPPERGVRFLPPRGEKRMRCFREAHSSLCTKSMAPCDRDPVSCHVVLRAQRRSRPSEEQSQLSTADPAAGLRYAPASCGSPRSWWSAQTRLGLAWPRSLASKGRE